MTGKYPRLGHKSKRGGKPGKTCKVCKKSPAVSRVDIEVNWFRGDDEVYYVCETCYRLPPAELLNGLGYK